jgi:cystathionine beta-lyase
VGELADLPVDLLEVLRTRRSAKWRTYLGDVLPLTVAEMDFALAPCVAQALHAAVDLSDTGYGNGRIGLAESLAGFALRRWGWAIDPSQVTGVTDVGSGVVQVFRLLIRPGDTVVVNTPVYHPFFDWVADVGAKLRAAPLAHDVSGWHLDLDALESAFAERPSVYLLCNPHNPVGRVHRAEELTEVVRLAHQYGVTVISDEIHAPLVYDGFVFTPFLTLDGAAEVAVSVLSASKAWNLAALQCAVVVTAHPRMAEVVGRFSPDAMWRTGHFGVIAAIAAFDDGEPWLDQLLATLGRRRAQLGVLLDEHLPMIKWLPPEATYLAWLDCRAIGSGDEPRDRFLEKGRVALESGPHFGPDGSGFIRLNFATSTEIPEAAVNGMAQSLSDTGTALGRTN